MARSRGSPPTRPVRHCGAPHGDGDGWKTPLGGWLEQQQQQQQSDTWLKKSEFLNSCFEINVIMIDDVNLLTKQEDNYIFQTCVNIGLVNVK